MESTSKPDPHSSLASSLVDDSADTHSAWQPSIRNSYVDAERAMEALVELGLRATDSDGRALLTLGASLAVVVQCLDAHHRAVETEAIARGRPPLSVVSRHLAYCKQVHMKSLESLEDMLQNATSCSSLAQAVVVTAVVMLQDWYAHGRLLSTLWEETPRCSPGLCC